MDNEPVPPNAFFKGVALATLICLPFWMAVWWLVTGHRPSFSAPVAGTCITLALLLILWGYNRTLPKR